MIFCRDRKMFLQVDYRFPLTNWKKCKPAPSSSALYIYGRLPKTRTFKGNRKKVRVIWSSSQVIESSKKIAESTVKNSFYCTVNILITFNCRNVK